MTYRALSSIVVASSLVLLGVSPSFAKAGDTDQQRQERWQDLQKQIFGDKKLDVDAKAVQCQSAANFDPGSACNFDPSGAACLEASVALAPA